jgi:hypothetical protein
VAIAAILNIFTLNGTHYAKITPIINYLYIVNSCSVHSPHTPSFPGNILHYKAVYWYTKRATSNGHHWEALAYKTPILAVIIVACAQ